MSSHHFFDCRKRKSSTGGLDDGNDGDDDGNFASGSPKTGGKTKVKTRNGYKSSASKERKRKQHKQVELTNFYRFQFKQDKQRKLDQLREKFESDKQKVALLKANRKFKPF